MCDSDSCSEAYENITGDDIDEDVDILPSLEKHFSEKLHNFPFDIITEDYYILYKKNS